MCPCFGIRLKIMRNNKYLYKRLRLLPGIKIPSKLEMIFDMFISLFLVLPFLERTLGYGLMAGTISLLYPSVSCWWTHPSVRGNWLFKKPKSTNANVTSNGHQVNTILGSGWFGKLLRISIIFGMTCPSPMQNKMLPKTKPSFQWNSRTNTA